MKKLLKRGFFVVLEGIDGGGKTTQAQLLAARLRDLDYDVLTSREPGGTALAEKVRALVLDPALPLNTKSQALLYLAARSEHVEKILRPAYAAGKIVICDRFSASTLVYQGLAVDADAAAIQSLRELCAFASGNFTPDITLLLDAEPEQLLRRRQERGASDRYEVAGLAFQKRLRQGFLQLAALSPQSYRIIDALKPPGAVTQALLAAVLEFLPRA